ncbi:MAG: diguanylate cyclase [Thermoanaerobaculia bacterium]|nr:diguanylate cyclase [Thermoanaerobaculia bacterium]
MHRPTTEPVSLTGWTGREPSPLDRHLHWALLSLLAVMLIVTVAVLAYLEASSTQILTTLGAGALAGGAAAGWLARRVAIPLSDGLSELSELCRNLDEGWRYHPDAIRPPRGLPRSVAELYLEFDAMAQRLGSANERLRGSLEESERLRDELEKVLSFREEEIRERTQALRFANEELKRLAREDGLTGIANHRTFMESADQTWRIVAREQRWISILMIDVDHFKAYNDIYGHQAGDQALRQIAKIFRDHARRPLDLAARYGGEEFAVVLGNTDLDDARGIAERIRRGVEELTLPHSGSPEFGVVTVSIGVAALIPMPEVGVATLISLADKALYRAKSNGRNRLDHSWYARR